MRVIFYLSAFLSFLAMKSQGQIVITLANASFEQDAPGCGTMPAGWVNRNTHNLPQSGVQPGCDGVDAQAYDGKQYISLKSYNGLANDRIGQRLPANLRLEKGSTYSFSLYLAYSETMFMTDAASHPVSLGNPALLRILGYNTRLNRQELLYETPIVDHLDWEAYDLTVMPKQHDYDELDFEVWVRPSQDHPVNGNVLIDSISAIHRVKAYRDRILGAAIPLDNASFEDEPDCCKAPNGWYNCGPGAETPPDVQPGTYGVELAAYSGKTYLGLVVRDNNTQEAVGQHLEVALQPGKVYEMKCYLARSALLLSLSRISGEEVNYSPSACLRIWGGSADCDRKELLGETDAVTNTDWTAYMLYLQPKGTYDYLTLEAYYKAQEQFLYNGNLLIDDLSLYLSE